MDQNPYESPKVADTAQKPGKLSGGRFALAIVLGLLTVPAVGLAFFGTCLATFGITGFDTAPNVPWIGGLIGGTAAAVGMIWLTMRVARPSK